MVVDGVRAVLLLGADLLPVNKIVMRGWHHVCRENVSRTIRLVLVEAHCHSRSVAALANAVDSSQLVMLVVHFKDFLLLRCQMLRLTVLAVDGGKPHGAWHKYIILPLDSIRRLDLRLMHVVVLLERRQGLQVVLL